MKKNLLILVLTIFSLTSFTKTILPINEDVVNEKINNNNNVSKIYSDNNRTHRIILNVGLSLQQGEYYCVPASLQTIFRYYGFSYTQTFIFQQLNGSEDRGIRFTAENVNWINTQLALNHVNAQYYVTSVPLNFGRTIAEQIMFQGLVFSSLRQRIPVIMGYSTSQTATLHAVVIYGIELDENDSNNTIYYLRDSDPHTVATNVSFRGRDLQNLFGSDRGLVLSGNNSYDFRNRTLSVQTKAQSFGSILQDKSIERGNAMDLTEKAGIISLKQLKQFRIVEMHEFSIKTSWFDKIYEYNKKESWQTRWFVNGKADFKEYSLYSWEHKYLNIARAKFKTYYSSSTWKEKDGSFYLSLSYRFFANALLTSTFVYAKIFIGSKWILKF